MLWNIVKEVCVCCVYARLAVVGRVIGQWSILLKTLFMSLWERDGSQNRTLQHKHTSKSIHWNLAANDIDACLAVTCVCVCVLFSESGMIMCWYFSISVAKSHWNFFPLNLVFCFCFIFFICLFVCVFFSWNTSEFGQQSWIFISNKLNPQIQLQT